MYSQQTNVSNYKQYVIYGRYIYIYIYIYIY